MNINENDLLGYLAAFMWPFFRLSSMFIAMPVLSVKAAPNKTRVMLSALITFLILPVLPAMPAVPLFSFEGWMVTIQQIGIGITAGFILQMVFSIVLFAGQAIAYSMGLGFASMVDPASGVQVPVVAQLFVISGSLLFLALNGHLLVIEMIVQSFSSLPVGLLGLEQANLWQVVMWSSQIFADGVLLSLPILATLLFVNISFGVASKAAPQLQVFGVGFPITILLGMVLIWVGISTMIENFTDMLHAGFAFISQILRLS